LTTNLNFENTDNVTHMLVSGFTGALNQDLDADEDGTLDSTPWSSLVECVAIVGPAAGDLTYCATSVGPEGPFHPAHIFKSEDGPNWAIGKFNTTIGCDTPGSENPHSIRCQVVPTGPPTSAPVFEVP
jgi:hypothetical protein